ncbi:MAG: hypothetical protein ACI8QC_000401 [Planctomycetota bacterium]|jgi:hypothetical protein
MTHSILTGQSFGGNIRRDRMRSVRQILDGWRTALGVRDVLERAYLFVSLLQDAHLLRRAAEEALPGARSARDSVQAAPGAWWAGLLPPAVDRFGSALVSLRGALAEQSFWRRLDGLPPMPELESLLPGEEHDWSAQAALELARLSALLRTGPDGHALLALAELASGLEQRASQRLAALERLPWRSTADEPYRVAQCLALGRGVLCEGAGDLAGLRRELPAVSGMARAPWALLGARYALALWEGADDELEALEQHVHWRVQQGLGPVQAADLNGMNLPLERWSREFRPAGVLRLGRAVEQAPEPLRGIAKALLAARQGA